MLSSSSNALSGWLIPSSFMLLVSLVGRLAAFGAIGRAVAAARISPKRIARRRRQVHESASPVEFASATRDLGRS
jgi:hypothetical protein